MKYTINELANSKGVSQPVREALLHMAEYKQLYEQVCEQYDVLAKELEATNRQVEILSDALAESRREVAAPVREDWGPGPHEYHSLPAQRQWVGLTDEERMDCIFATNWSKKPLMDTAKLIEAKLKEKNNG